MTDVIDISMILLDLNGVLYRYDQNARIDYLAAAAERSPDAVKAAIWESGFEDLGDSGALDADAYLHAFGTRIGCAISEAQWLAAQLVAVAPIVPTLGLLPRLRPKVRCAVLTNNNLLVLRHFSTLYPEVVTLVGARACVSAEFGARKPDPDVYHRCLSRLSVAPAETLFVDDSVANVAGARKAGLRGYHYAGFGALAAELRRWRVLAPRDPKRRSA